MNAGRDYTQGSGGRLTEEELRYAVLQEDITPYGKSRWFNKADVERILAARRRTDEDGLRADIEALCNAATTSANEFGKRTFVLDVDEFRAVLARHAAEPDD